MMQTCGFSGPPQNKEFILLPACPTHETTIQKRKRRPHQFAVVDHGSQREIFSAFSADFLNRPSHCKPFRLSQCIWHLHRPGSKIQTLNRTIVEAKIHTVHILSSTSVPFRPTTVPMVNLALIETKRITVHRSCPSNQNVICYAFFHRPVRGVGVFLHNITIQDDTLYYQQIDVQCQSVAKSKVFNVCNNKKTSLTYVSLAKKLEF